MSKAPGLNIEGLCNTKGCKGRGKMVWYPWGFRNNGKFNYFFDEDDVKCPVCEQKIVIHSLGFKDTWYQISGFRRASQSKPLEAFKSGWKHAGGTKPVINSYGKHGLDLWAEMEIDLSQRDPSAPDPPPQQTKPPPSQKKDTTQKDPNGETSHKPKHFYILIGINHYITGPLKKSKDGRTWKYGHLHGCVRDINAVELYLIQKLEVHPDNIFKLLAEHKDMSTNWKKTGPAGNPENWPTHNNITALLKKVTDLAREGDLIYIHYAGHGGRTQPTAFPGIKMGVDQSDESLVPCDIHAPGGKYILDLELASYLNTIVNKGITLTVVLDSCHSSSASRVGVPETEGNTPRGGSDVDANPPPPTLTEADIRRNLQGVLRSRSRNAMEGTPEEDSNAFWLNPTGYELLAACRFDQTAKENSTVAKDEGSHGIFTYYYLQALKQSYPHSISHQQMHQRLQKMIDMKQFDQSPVFFGAGDRALFGQEHVQDHEATVGVSSGEDPGTVTLDIGAIHGVRIGAEFRLFPSNAREPSATDPRVKITEVKELKSIAEFLPESPKLAREQLSGGQYRAVSLSSPVEPIHVYLKTNDSCDLRFDGLKQVLEDASDVPVEFVSRLDNASYQVQIDPDGNYTLYHIHRCQSQHTFSPVLDFPRTDIPNLFMDGLTHLAKFTMVKELKNVDQTLLLGHNFEFKVIQSPNVKVGKNSMSVDVHPLVPVSVEFTNKFTDPVSICILNLQPLWGISKILPNSKYGEPFATIDVKETRRFKPWKFQIPSEVKPQRVVTDYLLVFVFADKHTATNFNTLLMPELKDNLVGTPSNRGSDGLSRLFAAMGLPQRNVMSDDEEVEPWNTALITVNVHPISSSI